MDIIIPVVIFLKQNKYLLLLGLINTATYIKKCAAEDMHEALISKRHTTYWRRVYKLILQKLIGRKVKEII